MTINLVKKIIFIGVTLILILFILNKLFTVTILEYDKSYEEQTMLTIRIYNEVIERIKNDIGFYPDSKYKFDIIYNNVYESPYWRGPYFGRGIKHVDSWGYDIIYNFPAKCNVSLKTYELYSVGQNGVNECFGGDDIFESR